MDGQCVHWSRCPFTDHIPWDMDCDCQDDEILMDEGYWNEPSFTITYEPRNLQKSSSPSNPTSRKEPAPPMFMLSATGSNTSYDFPPYQPFEKDNLSYTPKIPHKKVILPMGEHTAQGDIEATLNW